MIRAVSVSRHNQILLLSNGIADEMQWGDTVWRMRVKRRTGGRGSAVIGGKMSTIRAPWSVRLASIWSMPECHHFFRNIPWNSSRCSCGVMRQFLSAPRHLMSHQSFCRHRVASLRDALPSLAVRNFPGDCVRLESSHLWYLIGPFCHKVISVNKCHLRGK